MGALSKAMGFPDTGESADETDAPASESTEKAKPAASAEVLAMKQFTRASTPEAKAAAMRDFLEACGCTTDSGEGY